jgi:hypothetical protein
MDLHHLDATYAAALIQRQRLLQQEALQVLHDLDLLACLTCLGHAEHVGSSASGLMVWRDLDVGARCPHPRAEAIFGALQPILAHPGIREVHYYEQSGERSPSQQPADQRYYFVLRYATPIGDLWKIDISIWLSDAPRNQVPYLDYLARTLNDETRLAILWIKDVWHRLPSYPDSVSGIDIYTAVLAHQVRTPAQFANYLAQRGQ